MISSKTLGFGLFWEKKKKSSVICFTVAVLCPGPADKRLQLPV